MALSIHPIHVSKARQRASFSSLSRWGCVTVFADLLLIFASFGTAVVCGRVSSALVAKSSMTEPHLCPARAWFVHPWHFSSLSRWGCVTVFADLLLIFASFGTAVVCGRVAPVSGFCGSVATELHFCLCVQVRWLTCYGPLPLCFNGFEAAVSLPPNFIFVCVCRFGGLPATVLYLCVLTVSKLQFRHRVEGLRTHGFWLAWARI